MIDSSIEARLAIVLDAAYEAQANLERIARTIPLGPEEREQLGRDISRVSHAIAEDIIAIVGDDPSEWGWAKEQLHEHPLHKDFLLQSDFISQALVKPYGYAGDKDLMLMIYSNADRGSSAYAELKNHVYQSLPAAEAVRQRVRGMERLLRSIPNGSKILCLACGPAWEVQQIAKERNLNFQIDLLDHDPQTVAYTKTKIRQTGVSHVHCNAFDIIKGKTEFDMATIGNVGREKFTLSEASYDLVYTTGLYDYIASFPMNPNRGSTGLTTKLFNLLKPGGKLIVGNFLTPGGRNLHKVSHQFMMEAYSEWSLLYRTPEEVLGFADKIPKASHKIEMFDETISASIGAQSVIGFLAIEKLQ